MHNPETYCALLAPGLAWVEGRHAGEAFDHLWMEVNIETRRFELHLLKGRDVVENLDLGSIDASHDEAKATVERVWRERGWIK